MTSRGHFFHDDINGAAGTFCEHMARVYTHVHFAVSARQLFLNKLKKDYIAL